MSIRGFARETIFTEYLKSMHIKMYLPREAGRPRCDKADHAIKNGSKFILLQMKGISTNNCNFGLPDPVLATETQLTRGRVNDHATQSRLYLATDFDFLILGIDPPVTKLCRTIIGSEPKLQWEFYAIPTLKLLMHQRMTHRLKSLQKFKYSELQPYKIHEQWVKDYAEKSARG